MELPRFSVKKHSRDGWLCWYKCPLTGKRKNLRLWKSTDTDYLPPSKQTAKKAKERAAEVLKNALGVVERKVQRSSGVATTISEFMDMAMRDPGSRGATAEATLEGRKHVLEMFRRYLKSCGFDGDASVSCITQTVIEDYLAALAKGGLQTPTGCKSKPYSQRSLVRQLQYIKRAFNYGLQGNRLAGIAESPARWVKVQVFKSFEEQVDSIRERSIGDELFEKLLAACSGELIWVPAMSKRSLARGLDLALKTTPENSYEFDNRGAKFLQPYAPWYMEAVIRLIDATGTRPGEAVSAKWRGMKKISEGGETFYMCKVKGKTGTRQVILFEEDYQWFEGYRERLKSMGVSSPYILCNSAGEPLAANAINQAWRRLRERLGIEGKVKPYGLRHRYAQKCNAHGDPEPDIAAAMGHTDTRTTRIYTQTNPEQAALRMLKRRKGA